ncbi:unnamed protein product [Moneuplotes crassus]|uniref:Uncharacterized protein n=1 Tax=Euplotes crassus TaxID=5936 RepID=A0AAD1Y0L6_EUPCR|nr:unnamed protein product [Moneuplotes crassus]
MKKGCLSKRRKISRSLEKLQIIHSPTSSQSEFHTCESADTMHEAAIKKEEYISQLHRQLSISSDRNKKLSVQIRGFHEEIDRISRKHDEEIYDLKITVERLQKENSKLGLEKVSLEQFVETNEEERSKMITDLATTSAELGKYKAKFEVTENEISDLRKRLDLVNQERNQSINDKQTLSRKLAIQESENKDLEYMNSATVHDLQKKLTNEENKRKIYEAQSSDKDVKNVKLESEVCTLKTQVDKYKTKALDFEEKLRVSSEKLAALIKDKTESSSKLLEAVTECESYKSQLTTVKARIIELESYKKVHQKENFKEKYYTLLKQNKMLKEANYQSTDQLTRDYSEMQSLKDSNFDLKSTNKELSSTLAQLKKFLSDTKDSLDERNMTLFKLEKDANTLKQEHTKLELFNKSTRKENDRLLKDLQQAEKKNRELNEKIYKINCSIEQKIQNKDYYDEGTSKEIERLHKRNSELQDQMAEYKYKFDKVARLNETLKQQMEGITQEIIGKSDKEEITKLGKALNQPDKFFPSISSLMHDEDEEKLAFMNVTNLNEKLTRSIIHTDKLNLRKAKLENLQKEICSLCVEDDISQVCDYIKVCLSIAVSINETILSKEELLRARMQQIIQSKMMDQTKKEACYEEFHEKGNDMKKRYEDARVKLMRYQNQIAECAKLKEIHENRQKLDYKRAEVKESFQDSTQDQREEKENTDRELMKNYSCALHTEPVQEKRLKHHILKRSKSRDSKDMADLLLSSTSLDRLDENETLERIEPYMIPDGFQKTKGMTLDKTEHLKVLNSQELFSHHRSPRECSPSSSSNEYGSVEQMQGPEIFTIPYTSIVPSQIHDFGLPEGPEGPLPDGLSSSCTEIASTKFKERPDLIL